MPTHNSRLITGLALQALSLFVVYASAQWLYAIGWLAVLVIAIPLFLVSIYLLMTTGASLPLRLLLSFWPLTIPLMIAGYRRTLVALQWRMVRTEVLLVPADFRGWVTVVFDDPQGVPPLREGGKAVFKIGANGNLHTRDHSPYAHVEAVNQAIDQRREFYAVDKSGVRIRLPLYSKGQPPDQPAVHWGVSYVNFQRVDGRLESSRYEFYWFFVGTEAEYAQPH